MKIKIVNKSNDVIKVGLDLPVSIEVGSHEYDLTKPQVDEVVNSASVLEELEVQLMPQPETEPSTVDGAAKVKEVLAKNVELDAALKAKEGELEKALLKVADLEKSEAELTEKLKTANAGGDKSEGEKLTVKKTAAKTTTKKTENKE